MKPILLMLSAVFLFAACKDKKEVSASTTATVNTSNGIHQIPSAYWYSFDLFSGSDIFIGSLSIMNQKPNDFEGTTSTYRFTITEVIRSSPDVKPMYAIGDVIESETFREIVDHYPHVLCFSRYPEGEDGETVIDGGFPLPVDDKVSHALQIIRAFGSNPEKYSEEDYKSIRGLLKFPENHDFNRENGVKTGR